MSRRLTWPGQPHPLGAVWDGEGTNFALYAEGAEAVDLCLFDESGREERIPLEEMTFHVWHGYLPGVGPGTRYGYRVDGPYTPSLGQRWNPSKLLVDPYALAIDGAFTLDDAVFGFQRGRLKEDLQDHRDSARFVPRGVVVHDVFDWGEDLRPHHPLADTVIYELHVKGFTAAHPDIPIELRGTYAGLAHPAAIEHLRALGVTAVELMPVHHFVSEPALLARGLTNHWGYNSLGFFAPHAAYSSSGSSGQQVTEFKGMVRALHEAGIEVLLDVVYNHTCESDRLGPTLFLRGIANEAYYRLDESDKSEYVDYTGTGNTLDVRHPHSLQLIMDSLRYWVTEMHVDGFRFDLAAALARSMHDVDKLSAFFDVIHQDPVISRVKLIAEPWDLGEGGYQIGEFPALWTEWNGKYRDTVRDFWRGYGGLRELAFRLSGSSDLYQDDGRRPFASINFITAHDGFTLADLVSFESKHNEANGEDNRDGSSDNRSWNCGVEGPTDDPSVLALRARQRRNLLATLLLSTGVPMVSMGDELGRTQRGNNNAYCQDNEISWVDWAGADLGFLTFAQALVALRRQHPVLRQRAFFRGRALGDGMPKDIGWFGPDGLELDDAHWFDPQLHTIGMYLAGDGIKTRGPRGERIVDDSFLLLLNGSGDDLGFTTPGYPWATGYEVAVETTGSTYSQAIDAGAEVRLIGRSLVLLRALRQ
ncbi:MAG: isoamylase [Frankiales bacterium]|nr:isoamylase [Frankiales bacterium]